MIGNRYTESSLQVVHHKEESEERIAKNRTVKIEENIDTKIDMPQSLKKRS